MILTVDFNPIFKRKYTFDSLDANVDNIPEKTQYGAGGQGIEMAYLINSLNQEVKVIGYLGGINGTYIQYNLIQLEIPNSFIHIKEETPETIILDTNSKEIIIKSHEVRLTRDEVDNFYELFNKTLMQADIICLAGEIPSSIPKEIIYDFVSMAKRYNLMVLIKLKGEELKSILDSQPSYLLIDREDLEDLTNLRLSTIGEMVKASSYIMDRGIEKLIINLDNRGSILITQDSYYRVNILNDSREFITNTSHMLGGYAFAESRGYDIEMAAKIGQACGIANSYIQGDIKDMGHIKQTMNEIEVKKYD